MAIRDWFSRRDASTESPKKTLSAQQLLQQGAEQEADGNFDEALSCYLEASRLDATLGRAHFCAGVLLLARNQAEDALAAFEKALAIKPDSAGALLNLGNACMQLGKAERALAAYQAAIGIKPDFTEAELGVGTALEALGKLHEAIAHYQRVLVMQPAHALARFSLGRTYAALDEMDAAVKYFNTLLSSDPQHLDAWMALADLYLKQSRFDEAERACREALAIAPDRPEALFNLAMIAGDRGDVDGAIAGYREVARRFPENDAACINLGALLSGKKLYREAAEVYRRALELNPDSPVGYNNLGNALTEMGLYDEAIRNYRAAIDRLPDFADAWGNMGVAFHGVRKFDQAVECFNEAIRLRPEHPATLTNLGGALHEMGFFDEALENYNKSLALQPDSASVLSNIGMLLKDRGRMEEALVYCRKALDLEPNNLQYRGSMLFIMNYLAQISSGQLLEEARKFDVIAREKVQPFVFWENSRDKNRTLRIGLVSGDMMSHPVGFFLEGVMQALAHGHSYDLQFVAYPTRSLEDEVTARIRACCVAWRPVKGVRDEDFAKLVRDDKIDILIDLSGYSGHHRLPAFAWKPAPIQVTWLGYFATTGLSAMDYLIADPWTLPEGEEPFFSETIWRLPETRLCFTAPRERVAVSALPAEVNGYITFGCFNHLTKVNNQVIALWARILEAVPGSRLFLKATQLREPETRRSLLARFAMCGISSERLILEGATPRAEYLAAYHRVDIALDPFPYTGGTTTAETLWMGVPVLTLAGAHFLARQGVGLLMNAGLPEWVATDQADYFSKAVAHAGDVPALASLRRSLRAQVVASPVFDAHRFAGHFSSALRQMWCLWCDR